MEQTGFVIVGAGVCGLKAASRLSCEGLKDFIVLEKQATIGGVWSSYANRSSRVQISEPSYRLATDRPLTEYTPQQELLEEMEWLCRHDGLHRRMRLGCEVFSARELGNGQGVEVAYRNASGAVRTILATDHVLLCTGGLQQPRSVQCLDEDLFRGNIIMGMGSAIDNVLLAGRRVAILGMGAFAIENARTALLAGAAHVTIVARSKTLVVSRLALFFNAMNHGRGLFRGGDPGAQRLQVATGDGSTSGSAEATTGSQTANFFLSLISAPYKMAGAGHLVPKDGFGATVPTCSDVFFIALKLGRLDVILGEVASFGAGCLRVDVKEVAPAEARRREVSCDVVVKCFGFEPPDKHLAGIVGRERIRSPLYITERILLMKVEHNPKPLASPRTRGLDLGGSATIISDLYLEIFLHFREHPAELQALMGQLPNPAFHDDSYSDLFESLCCILDAVPGVAERARKVRARYAAQVKAKYPGGLPDFLRSNRADWEEACSALAGGDRQAVPYMWEGMQAMAQLASTEKRPSKAPAAFAKL